MIKLKRVYDQATEDDGYRILVDRLWPRGISKEKGGIDYWMREVSPSNELRKKFSHQPALWPMFLHEYEEELSPKRELLQQLLELEEKHGTITFLFATKEEKHNNAVALLQILRRL